mmetsp:Transcript_32442/g.67771  ORF Transcript_32442/g.67771 Transcript_32442/m.67771 type:complete len:95 (+) Transcript_32442:2179-2463(+)
MYIGVDFNLNMQQILRRFSFALSNQQLELEKTDVIAQFPTPRLKNGMIRILSCTDQQGRWTTCCHFGEIFSMQTCDLTCERKPISATHSAKTNS